MKRDMDFVRELLLKIEEGDGKQRAFGLLTDPTQEDVDKLSYHMRMLVGEAGLVTGTALQSGDWLHLNLTWVGHEFLDTVRDPEVWKRTKEGAKKAGNFSLDFLIDLAKAYGKHLVKERLGFDLS